MDVYQRIFEATPDALLVVDDAGRVTRANARAETLFDAPRSDLVGGAIEGLLPRCFPPGRPRPAAHVARRKDGTEVPVDVSLCAIETDDGTQTLCVVRDATERRRAEDDLTDARAQWEQSFDALKEYICVLDPSGRIVLTNRSMRERFEPIHGDLVGLDFRQIYYGAGPSEDATAALAALNGGPPIEIETTLPALPGYFAVSCCPLRSREPGARGAVHVVRDVTQARIFEESLRQSQKLQAIGQLAGSVAHDFNNLLTVIHALCDRVISAVDVTDPLHPTMTMIRDAGARAALLTRQLLVFSRTSPAERTVLDLNGVLRHTAEMLSRLIGENIALDTDLDPELSSIRADRGQIEQVIMNLSLNARDAMPGGGRLTLETRNVTLSESDARARPELRAGCFVRLSVRDNGVGMTTDVQQHLFEPFFTTKEAGKGTGLGLATVYGIVQQAEGFVTVETAVDAGTCLRVFLPAVEAPSESESDSGGRATPGGEETILLVEDDNAVREAIRYELEICGYQVLEARSSRQALDLIDAHRGPIDLLLTDVVLPEMNGRTLAEVLCSRRPGQKVLFMTGYTNDVVDGGRLTIGAVLYKPFTSAGLAQKVRELLGPPVRTAD